MTIPKESILLVDDEEAIRCILNRGLAIRGYNCDEAEDAEQALAKLEVNPSDHLGTNWAGIEEFYKRNLHSMREEMDTMIGEESRERLDYSLDAKDLKTLASFRDLFHNFEYYVKGKRFELNLWENKCFAYEKTEKTSWETDQEIEE